MGEYNKDDLGAGWSKKTALDPKSGKSFNRYFYKRRKAHCIEIDTPKAKVLSGYALIEKDLRSAIVWLNEIIELLDFYPGFDQKNGYVKSGQDRDKFNVAKGLFVAALTFYGKSFSQCEGRRIKLERSNLDEALHEQHDEAMSFRHNFAAHSGARKIEMVRVVIALDSRKRKGTPPYMGRELSQPDSPVKSDIEDMIELFKHAQKYTNDKIETLTKKVYSEDILEKGSDYWYGET